MKLFDNKTMHSFEQKDKRVVVVGHGYSSRLSIIRSVGMAGYEVDVVVIYYGGVKPSQKPIDCHSKYVNQIYYSPAGNEEALIRLLIKNYSNFTSKPILIPESDFSVKAIDKNLNKLMDLFLIPNIDGKQGAVVEWMDKERQKKQAKHIGLTVAECVRISIVNEEYNLPQGIRYPCFPKPVDGGKKGLGVCNSSEELEKYLNYVSSIRHTLDILVEDYLEIDNEFALVGFSDGENVTIPAVLRIEGMSRGGHFGVARNGRVLPLRGFESLIEQFKEFVKSIHFVGLFDIDFFFCKDEFYFDEINLRFGGSGYAVTKAVANLPAMMADFFLGIKRDSDCGELLESLSYANERICLDDWYGGYISYREYKKILDNVDIRFIFDNGDRAPYYAFKRFEFERRIKNFIIPQKCRR